MRTMFLLSLLLLLLLLSLSLLLLLSLLLSLLLLLLLWGACPAIVIHIAVIHHPAADADVSCGHRPMP